MRHVAPALGLLFLLAACSGGSSSTANASPGGANSLTADQQGQQQGPHGTPPQEALDACSGQADGDACSFVSPRGDTVSGLCTTTPSGSAACKPDKPMGPPQASLDACVGMTDGTSCSFVSPRGDTVAGLCATINDAVACKPDRPNGPPQEAVNACSGLTDGASCAFYSPRGDAVSGTCTSFNGNTACKPDQPIRGNQGQGRQSRP